MAVTCPDVSEFQTALTGGYGRDFVIFRGSFGANYKDKRFLANANAAAALHASGKLAGAVVYTVFLPGNIRGQFNYLWSLIGPTAPSWLAGIMIDVEHWGGTSYAISGDHSAEINTLYGLHAQKMGSYQSVIAYGNQSDLASIYPKRDPRCRVVVAGYSSRLTFRSVRGSIGQQYTDGSGRWPTPAGLPTATVPFGRCDHNVFPDFANGAALRLSLRPSVAPPKPASKPTPVVSKPVPLYAPGPMPHTSPDRHLGLFLTNERLELHRDGVTIWHT
jgi:hypothetical protein